MSKVEAQLGIGVHPLDSSVPSNQVLGADNPIPETTPTSSGSKVKPFNTRNDEALPVYERGSHEWTATTLIISNAIQILPKQEGRKLATLYVSSTATEGVIIGPDRGQIEVGYGAVLNPGDSIDLKTEGSIYAAPIAGQTTGTVTVVSFFNPPKVS